MTFTTLASDDSVAAIATDAAGALDDAALSHAVIGLGRFGCVHARKLLALDGFRLAALVDCSASARVADELAKLPLMSGLEELPPGIESATIAANDEAHAGLALALMRRGCHVLVEKPLCVDRRDGLLMIQSAHQCGVTLATGHIERFNPVFDAAMLGRLRNAMTSHRLGSVPFMRFSRCSTRVASAKESVLDLMVHDLDLFAWLCAVPSEAPLEVLERHVGGQSVRARVRLGTLIAEFESGYGGSASARLQFFEGGREHQLDLRDDARAQGHADDALARQYRAFRQAILGRPSRIASGADGLAAVTRACQVLRA